MKKASELGIYVNEVDGNVFISKNPSIKLSDSDPSKSAYAIETRDLIACSYKLLNLPLLVIEDELSEHELFMIKASVSRDDIVNWKKGYSRAKETYKFTEEDLRRDIKMSKVTQKYKYGEGRVFVNSDESIIQSLTKKELWIEVEQVNNKPGASYSSKTIFRPKITNNQIKAQWRTGK